MQKVEEQEPRSVDELLGMTKEDVTAYLKEIASAYNNDLITIEIDEGQVSFEHINISDMLKGHLSFINLYGYEINEGQVSFEHINISDMAKVSNIAPLIARMPVPPHLANVSDSRLIRYS